MNTQMSSSKEKGSDLTLHSCHIPFSHPTAISTWNACHCGCGQGPMAHGEDRRKKYVMFLWPCEWFHKQKLLLKIFWILCYMDRCSHTYILCNVSCLVLSNPSCCYPQAPLKPPKCLHHEEPGSSPFHSPRGNSSLSHSHRSDPAHLGVIPAWWPPQPWPHRKEEHHRDWLSHYWHSACPYSSTWKGWGLFCLYVLNTHHHRSSAQPSSVSGTPLLCKYIHIFFSPQPNHELMRLKITSWMDSFHLVPVSLWGLSHKRRTHPYSNDMKVRTTTASRRWLSLSVSW